MDKELKTVDKEITDKLKTYNFNSFVQELKDFNNRQSSLPLDSYLSNYESSTQKKKEQMLDFLKISSGYCLEKGHEIFLI